MTPKILVLDSYEGFKENAIQACLELNCEPEIIPAFSANMDLVSHIRRLYPDDSELDVIVTRGALGTFLSKYFPNTPISLANPDDIDFLYALKQAKQEGQCIGLIIRDEYEFKRKADLYCSILDINELRTYRYESPNDILEILYQAKQDGVNITVGGGTIAYAASLKLGLKNIFVPTSVVSLKRAIQSALLHAKKRQAERSEAQYQKIAMQYVEYGLMIIQDGLVRFTNKSIEKILNVKAANLYQLPCSQIPHLNGELENSLSVEKVLTIRSRKYLVKEERHTNKDAIRIITLKEINALQKSEYTVRNLLYHQEYQAKYSFSDMIAESQSIKKLIVKAKAYAATDAPILITGDSGTGKELISHSIHKASPRAEYPFVPINCAAIPNELLESELFGYEGGAFTNANKNGKMGLFEIADRGTIFLDEINSLPFSLQGKLLRVIETNEFRRVGSQRLIRVDVRIVSSTNADLQSMIRNKAFRSDLFYRISTLSIDVDGLHKRKEDILPLSYHFLQQYTEKYSISIKGFTPEEEGLLLNHPFEGNVRELNNTIHRFVIQYPFQNREDLLKMCFAPRGHADSEGTDQNKILLTRGTLKEMEREIIKIYLRECQNRNLAAQQLGISRSTLWRQMTEQT